MSVLQDRSKQETKSYCKLMFILSTKAHATGGGVRTIFDYMPKHSSYIKNTPEYPLLSSKLDHFMPALQERSKQETKMYSKLVCILMAEAHAKVYGDRTLFEYMPKLSSYIHNTP